MTGVTRYALRIKLSDRHFSLIYRKDALRAVIYLNIMHWPSALTPILEACGRRAHTHMQREDYGGIIYVQSISSDLASRS